MRPTTKLLSLSIFLPAFAVAQQYVLFNGGVGADERETAPETGTKLVFFADTGSYLSGVMVTIEDLNGQPLVNTLTKGPWLIVDLPEGDYQIRASLDDNAQGGVFSVTAQAGQEFAYMFTLDE